MAPIPTILLFKVQSSKESPRNLQKDTAPILVVSETQQTWCSLGSSDGDSLREANTEAGSRQGPYHTSSQSSNGRWSGREGAVALGGYQISAYLLTKASKAQECNTV